MSAEKLPIHKYAYFATDAEEFRNADNDVYYTDEKGRQFKRFYKGQPIPRQTWEVYFGDKTEFTPSALQEGPNEAPVPVERTTELSPGKEPTSLQAEPVEAVESEPKTTLLTMGQTPIAEQAEVEQPKKVVKKAEVEDSEVKKAKSKK